MTGKSIAAQQQGQLVELHNPMALIESAVMSGAPVETLEKLMGLQERHEANQARKLFFQAMQDFQRIKPELKRASSVSFGGGKAAYNFCPLSDIERALKEPLSECGLSYRFENLTKQVDGKDGAVFLTGIRCIVSHVSGHSEATEMFAPADGSGNKNAIQGIGSTSTYLMRYTLIAAFGLTTADEDNDGQTNSDLPFQRLIQMGQALQDINTFRAVLGIKEALAEGDYYQACEYIYSMPEATLTALWVASTKGGCFTTEERRQLKSNEMHSAKLDWHAKKEG